LAKCLKSPLKWKSVYLALSARKPKKETSGPFLVECKAKLGGGSGAFSRLVRFAATTQFFSGFFSRLSAVYSQAFNG